MEPYHGSDAAAAGKHAAPAGQGSDSTDIRPATASDADDVVVLSRIEPGLGAEDDPEADDDLETDDPAEDGLDDIEDDNAEDDDADDDDTEDDADDDDAEDDELNRVNARRGDPAAAVGAIVVESFQPGASGVPAVPMELGIPVASLQDSPDPDPSDTADSIPSDPSGTLPPAASDTTPAVASATAPPVASSATVPAVASGSQAATPARNPEWSEIKALFVDDPQASVVRASELIEKAIGDLADSLRTGRASLVPAAGQGTSGPDTERLRLALRSYLTVFDDLERIWGGLPFADESDHHGSAQA
jgi:hypothetical protein